MSIGTREHTSELSKEGIIEKQLYVFSVSQKRY